MDESTIVHTAVSENMKIQTPSVACVASDLCRTRISLIKSSTELLAGGVLNITGDECNRFNVESRNDLLLEKGVLIHIVEDPTLVVAGPQQEQSAVLINVPSGATGASNVHNTDSLDFQEDVFSTAQVTVSVQYLSLIPEDRHTFFKDLSSSMNLKVADDMECVTLQGAWNQILMAQAAMKSYLTSWKQQEAARHSFDTLTHLSSVACSKEDENSSAIPRIVTVAHGSHMRTRHQERLQAQKEKLQVRGRRKSGKVEEDEEDATPGLAPPRENKENEVHLSISLEESAPCELSQKDLTSEELYSIPSSSGEQCFETKNCKGPKKNYEKLAPFKFFCNICSFKTKRESHYQRHLERHETISNLYSCDTCNFTTMRLGHLRRHELTHSTSMLSCSLCTYHTDDERHLSRHRRLKHLEQEENHLEKPVKILSCGKCSYSTTKMHLFQRHLKVHSAGARQQNPRNFQCEQCSYKTTRKEHYLRHVNNVHQNRRPYLCDFCGKAFKRPDALKQHGITHAEVDPTVAVFRCSFCNKGCRSQAHLNEHLAVHSNVRSFLCEICGLSFKTRSVQRKHVLTIHKNPHAFSCHRCLKRFNTKYALRRHMKQHSWKDEEECGTSTTAVSTETHTVLIQTTESSDSPSHNNTLTVQVPEEILASLPPGAVAVPLFSVMPNSSKKQVEDVSKGAAKEVLELQLKELPSSGEDSARPTELQTSTQHFLTTSADSNTPNILYVTTNYEPF